MNKKYCKALNLPPKKSLSSAEYFRWKETIDSEYSSLHPDESSEDYK
jgi:hypothetical protein